MSAPSSETSAFAGSTGASAPSPQTWGQTPPPTGLRRFMGGPPAAVALRLLFISLVVGALLVWLNIHPVDVFYWLDRIVHRLWAFGWDAVREGLDYIIAGAVIVVPVWFVLRLMSWRDVR